MNVVLNKIKGSIQRNIVLVSNFSYLSFLQITTLLIPLITYPYLIRVLGKDLYGLVVFTQVIAGYFSIFISFGFTMTGAKEVSIHREDKRKLSEIVSTITIIKVIFLLISFVGLLGYFTYSDISYKWLYILAFWICIMDVVFPTWFFQGIEKMKFITIISLSSRLAFMLLIFVFIKSKEDVLWYPLSNLIGVIISGWASFHLIRKNGINFMMPSLNTMKEYIKQSYHFFLSNVLIQVYANSNKAIIGFFLDMGSVAYYDLAEKIVNLIKMPQTILSQTAFPRISANKNPYFIKKVLKLSFLLNLGLYIVLFFLAEYLVQLLGGKEMITTVPIVRILGLLAPIIAISNVMGILTLIPYGYNKLFTQMIGISVVVYLLMLSILIGLNIVSIYSLSIINVLVEIVVSIVSVYFVYKSNILWKKNTIISL